MLTNVKCFISLVSHCILWKVHLCNTKTYIFIQEDSASSDGEHGLDSPNITDRKMDSESDGWLIFYRSTFVIDSQSIKF